jgi:hypothetical protein
MHDHRLPIHAVLVEKKIKIRAIFFRSALYLKAGVCSLEPTCHRGSCWLVPAGNIHSRLYLRATHTSAAVGLVHPGRDSGSCARLPKVCTPPKVLVKNKKTTSAKNNYRWNFQRTTENGAKNPLYIISIHRKTIESEQKRRIIPGSHRFNCNVVSLISKQ